MTPFNLALIAFFLLFSFMASFPHVVNNFNKRSLLANVAILVLSPVTTALALVVILSGVFYRIFLGWLDLLQLDVLDEKTE